MDLEMYIACAFSCHIYRGVGETIYVIRLRIGRYEQIKQTKILLLNRFKCLITCNNFEKDG